MVAETGPLIDFFENFSDLRMRHQRVGLFGEGFGGLRGVLAQRCDAQIPFRKRDIGQRVLPCLGCHRCHTLLQLFSPLSHI